MNQSEILFQRAQACIPGGVNSPVRAFHGVGGTPVFFKQGKGAMLYDVDDRAYIDYVGSWGPMILGHAHPQVLAAVQDAIQNGLSFGAPCALEVALAEKIIQCMPSIEKVRMVSSGTEATMTAIRLARGITGRDKIIKCDGCYHGHSDSLLVKAGSGVLTLGLPATRGVPLATAQDTLVVPFNDLQAVETLFMQYPDAIAAMIIEPVAGNMGMICPDPGYLAALRAICDAYGALLIFDEVMTGFRVGLGGAQALYQVTPDLTTLGKVIGGGMPVGAVGGKAEWMNYLAPEGAVYQAGTLSGNPVAMAAGLATLQLIEMPGFYESLSQKTQTLMQGFARIGQSLSIPLVTVSQGGMFGFAFYDGVIRTYDDMRQADLVRFKRFYHGMLASGIYLAPSMLEAGFISSAHTDEDIHHTLAVAEQVLRKSCS